MNRLIWMAFTLFRDVAKAYRCRGCLVVALVVVLVMMAGKAMLR